MSLTLLNSSLPTCEAENNKNDKDILLEYSKYVAQKKLELTLTVYYTLSSFSEHL